MTGNYAYTPNIWPTVVTILLLMFLVGYSWRRRSVPGVRPFLLYLLLGVCHFPFKILQYLAIDFTTKIFWYRVETLFWLPIVAAMTCFVLEYTYPGRWLTRRNLALLFAVPLLFDVVGLTNDFHHLGWLGFEYNGTVVPLYGPFGWISVLFTLGLTALNIIVFAWLFIRSPQQRWPVAIMLAAIIITRGLTILNPFPPGSWFLYFPNVVISYIATAIALFGFRIFDPVPMARRTAIEQLHSGMLVLDPQGRIASLNPAAERMLGVSEKQAKRQPVIAFLPACPDGPSLEAGELEIEIERKAGPETRYYSLSISPLKDWRGLEAGRLVMLHDVSEQKKAHTQILEQQRVLATLDERERMARELHDSLGQVLSYTSFQVDAAAQLSRADRGNAAAAQLERLGDVVREAHADLREYILNLRASPSLQQPLFVSLRQYLDGYTINYNIRTQLTIDLKLQDERFSPETQLQIFRIIQEALSNARKHGKSRHVTVTFSVQDGQVCLCILDDGVGFQPEAIAASNQQHFGLQFMEERAALLGGSLRIQSEPGKGTQVTLEIPVKEG